MKLHEQVAIVGGGGEGLGAGIVRCLAEEGADIAVVDINGDIAKKMAQQVKKMGRKALPVIADLTEEKQVNKAVKDTVEFFGKVDILVNNIGGASAETLMNMMQHAASLEDATELPQYMWSSPDIWDRYYQLNLKSHVMLSHAVTPYFVKQRSGKIVNISSDAGRMAEPALMPYAAMKAGDISITWSIARALAPYNITVNCVCPGFIYTPLWERGAMVFLIMAREAKKMGGRLSGIAGTDLESVDLESMTPREFWLKYIVLPSTPNGREQTPEDIGKAVLFFVSEDARNITGQVLHVDGGMVMR
jgi:NAD(P)-dependent dehydrogenase (short-subunit alcohol dehydrogenase family)